MDDKDSFYAPKVWDFAYTTGQAPPSSSTPILKSFDAPIFTPTQTPILPSIIRQESASSSSSSSSKSSISSTSSTCSSTTLATAPETPRNTPPNAQMNTDSMPAWARTLPKECIGKDGMGILLFPTSSVPRCVVDTGVCVGGVKGGNGATSRNRKGGINRPGHPVLKLSVEEMDRV